MTDEKTYRFPCSACGASQSLDVPEGCDVVPNVPHGWVKLEHGRLSYLVCGGCLTGTPLERLMNEVRSAVSKR